VFGWDVGLGKLNGDSVGLNVGENVGLIVGINIGFRVGLLASLGEIDGGCKKLNTYWCT
jgi:hypothetical protein